MPAWMHSLYNALLYVNTLLVISVMVVYIISARRSRKPYNVFKAVISMNMAISAFVYYQLSQPGDFLAMQGADALLVRLSYSSLLTTLLIMGVVGVVGLHGQKSS